MNPDGTLLRSDSGPGDSGTGARPNNARIRLPTRFRMGRINPRQRPLPSRWMVVTMLLRTLNDTYIVEEEKQLSVGVTNGVLNNDRDPEGSPINASRVSGPANGVLAFNSSGSFTYTPNANFSGTDTFVYRASDGAANSNGTVTINVSNINDPPIANPDTYTVNQDVALTVNAANGVLKNDTDVDQETLRAERVTGTGPTHGTLTLNDDGSFSYQPTAGFVGQDSFQYRAVDGIGIRSAAVTVTIDISNTRPWRNPRNSLDVNDDGSGHADRRAADCELLESGWTWSRSQSSPDTSSVPRHQWRQPNYGLGRVVGHQLPEPRHCRRRIVQRRIRCERGNVAVCNAFAHGEPYRSHWR